MRGSLRTIRTGSAKSCSRPVVRVIEHRFFVELRGDSLFKSSHKYWSMAKGSGYGKTILFGEHFVVHGIPGIASAIGMTADAEVKRLPDGQLVVNDRRNGTEGYTEAKKAHQTESVERMLKMMGLYDQGMEITLGGNLPTMSGIGGSAASSVAIARAVSSEFGLGYDDDKINKVAYEMEKAFAGNPSGIDNTAATYGGLLWFQKSSAGGPDMVERLKLYKPIEIVIGNTGVVANTKEMVAGVAERRKGNPAVYDPVFERARKLAHEARESLHAYDIKRVGEMMDENHMLLQQIGVSSRELDLLVDIARKNGAYGAKLTGGGGGGCMLALTPGNELQEKVASAMEKAGFNVLRTRIGI